MEDIGRISSEKEYLNSKLSDVIYNPNMFNVLMGEDKYLFGCVSPKDDEVPFSRLLQYKTLYDTLIDLDFKIKFSFDKAIEYAYSDSVQNNYNIFKIATEEEYKAIYYSENALFRITILWDLLAQFYRLFYKVDVPKEKVYYKKLFNPKLDFSKDFKKKASEINDYFQEKDDTKCEGEWKGNHCFVNNMRNKMTHRNSPNVSVMSDFDINLKTPPTFLIKRIVEDYAMASKFINEILNDIKNEVSKYFKSNHRMLKIMDGKT